jgi:hypothetical protein
VAPSSLLAAGSLWVRLGVLFCPLLLVAVFVFGFSRPPFVVRVASYIASCKLHATGHNTHRNNRAATADCRLLHITDKLYIDYSSRFSWFVVRGLLGAGSTGSWELGAGSWELGAGSWELGELGAGSWELAGGSALPKAKRVRVLERAFVKRSAAQAQNKGRVTAVECVCAWR